MAHVDRESEEGDDVFEHRFDRTGITTIILGAGRFGDAFKNIAFCAGSVGDGENADAALFERAADRAQQ